MAQDLVKMYFSSIPQPIEKTRERNTARNICLQVGIRFVMFRLTARSTKKCWFSILTLVNQQKHGDFPSKQICYDFWIFLKKNRSDGHTRLLWLLARAMATHDLACRSGYKSGSPPWNNHGILFACHKGMVTVPSIHIYTRHMHKYVVCNCRKAYIHQTGSTFNLFVHSHRQRLQ